MGLEKGIAHGKEKRKNFKGSKRFSCGCRNNGSCTYCKGNRTHFDSRRRRAAEADLSEHMKGSDDE